MDLIILGVMRLGLTKQKRTYPSVDSKCDTTSTTPSPNFRDTSPASLSKVHITHHSVDVASLKQKEALQSLPITYLDSPVVERLKDQEPRELTPVGNPAQGLYLV